MRKNRTLELDKVNKKFLGVCAGLANYLEVEPWSVRLVFIGCLIFGGWFLIPLYFACWFLLDDASSGARTALTENLAVKHFRTVDYKKKIYRNPRAGKWLGVCAGIAEYLEVSVFAVRIVFVLLFVTTGGFPLIFYFAAWMVLDVKPDSELTESAPSPKSKEHFAEAFAGVAAAAAKPKERFSKRTAKSKDDLQEELQEELYSKRREFKYCARKFSSLHTRLARMEAYVTSSRFKLHREFRNMS